MLITNKEKLADFYADQRLWQGIPYIAVTKKGRFFVSFFSGKTKEELGNYSLLIKSDDDCVTFGEPVAAAYDGDDARCFDPVLWIDPFNRLWFMWNQYPEVVAYATICDDPDADELVFDKPFVIGKGYISHRPTILSSGEWLFPLAVWNVRFHDKIFHNNYKDKRAFAYSSVDHGKTFLKLGGARPDNRSFEEHIFFEHENGEVDMYMRSNNGIEKATSYDRGHCWTNVKDSGFKGPVSRFYISRLESGRVLLLNHYDFTGRNNLTAMLSEDDGKTFPYRLLFDERKDISYPVAVEKNGFLYIVYDRDRGAFIHSLAANRKCAKELLVAKITENDIIAGNIVTQGSYIKSVISKLGVYRGKDKNPYKERRLFSTEEYVDTLMKLPAPEDALDKVLHDYGTCCSVFTVKENETADELFGKFIEETDQTEKRAILCEITELFKKNSGVTEQEDNELVKKITAYINEHLTEDITVREIAENLYISFYYMCHFFKENTNTTVTHYILSRRVAAAKKLLLKGYSVTDACYKSGFSDASYFSKIFKKSEGVSPKKFVRENIKKP